MSDVVIEKAEFTNAQGRWVFLPIPPVCERCRETDRGDMRVVGPRYSESAGKVMLLCGRCSY